MKKVFALTLALCGMLAFSGCIMDEEISSLLEETLPAEGQWESFTFQSLNGNKDLVVTRVSKDDDAKLAISTSGYYQDYLAIAVYKKDCENSKKQAPYFDKLAQDFPPRMFGMDFLIVFLDIYENSSDKNVEWIKDLSTVQSYTNAATVCSGGACQKVFIPSFIKLKTGTVYYVNKNDIAQTRKGLTWDTEKDPEEQFQTMRSQVADVLDLSPITFNPPTVDPWDDADGNSGL